MPFHRYSLDVMKVYFSFVSVSKVRSENVGIYYQLPWNNNTRCNWYGKDNNKGPEYDCNQIGSEVAVWKWDQGPLGLCDIKVYGGKCEVLLDS